MSGTGTPMPPDRVEDVLRLHREYLAAPPPDEPVAPGAQPLASPPEARLEQDR